MAVFPGFLSAFLIGTAKAGRRAAKALANRRAAQSLDSWDDRALKDIGLTRSDLMGAKALPFYCDPTLHLDEVSRGHLRSRDSLSAKPAQTPIVLEPTIHLPSIGLVPAS